MYRQFCFPLPTKFVKILEKYKTSDHCKRNIYFSAGQTAIFQYIRRPNGQFFTSISILVSPAICALLCSLFFGLEVYSHYGPHWYHQHKKIPMPKPVSLKFCNCMLCQSLSSEVLLGLLFSALKQQTVANFLWAEPKSLEMDTFILNPQTAVRPPGNHFLLQWYVDSHTFWVFQRIPWAKESEIEL